MDKDLCLYRIHARPTAAFIPADAIVRGALLYDVPERSGDCFVIDTVDSDMFIRMKEIFSSISEP